MDNRLHKKTPMTSRLFFTLSEATGIPVPRPIAALTSATIRHSLMVEEMELEPLLADFAHRSQAQA